MLTVVLYEHHEVMGISPPLCKHHAPLRPTGPLETMSKVHPSSCYQHHVPLSESDVDQAEDVKSGCYVPNLQLLSFWQKHSEWV